MRNGAGLEIPGVLWRRDPNGGRLPLVLDSPHSGSDYPDDFAYCCPLPVLRRAEDAYVDELYEAAPTLGATLIGALFPRSYLDPNRAPDDFDPGLLDRPLPSFLKPRPVTRVGLVRRHAQPGVPIYEGKLSPDDILARIERYHAPYHHVLDDACDRLHREFGAVWHINCHSMPSHGNRRDGVKGEHGDFVLGDRDGTTCAPEFTEFVASFLRRLGYDVRINEGYKGVEIVRRQGRPGENRHSLQIEVDRSLYMDQRSLQRLPGFDRLRADLTHLVQAVGEFVRSNL
ncbi:MAG: N-formylglutamate amidohydrolase [Alphaproteobacteria bacterium]|nr:N-formylglutamate amidohydrolase [Alphaproteobacteria bacterium]MBV9583878.1 N-formylglutamate amidohydrolase [Alphaproteobacteria bacterium]